VRSCFASSATCSKREDCGHGAREGGGKEARAKEGRGGRRNSASISLSFSLHNTY